MIKTLLFFVALLAVAVGGAWLADRPGTILIEWPLLGASFKISLLSGVLLTVGAMVLAVFLWVLVRGAWRSPKSLSGFFSSRRRDRGYKALSTGMIAVGVGDLALAKKQAGKARKLIGEEPMTLMLEAQAAQLAGDATGARQSFEAMLDSEETRALGRRGLYIEAQRRGDGDEAMEMAKAATTESEKKVPGWAGTALFDMQTARSDWQGALITLSQNHNNKHVTKEQFRRYRAVILTAQAMEMTDRDNAAANMRPLLLEACKLAPGLVPAVTKAAGILNDMKDSRKASKLIEAAWRIEPHPELAESYAFIKSGDTALDRLKRVRSLHALMPDHTESKIAMVRALLDAREWAEARSQLTPLIEAHLTPRLCMLMAELEEGEKGDFGLVRQWLARSVGAHRDPVWVADGQVSDAWAPISPLTGKLDAFEWKVPVRELAQSVQPTLEADVIDEAGAEEDAALLPAQEDMVDITEPQSEPEGDDAKAEVVVAPATTEVEDIEPVEAREPESAAEAEVLSPVATPVDEEAEDKANGVGPDPEAAKATDDAPKEDEAKVKEVEFPLSQAPDDPGPKKQPVDAGSLPPTPEKRFRLF